MSSQNINNSGLRVVINSAKVKTSADPSFGTLVKQNIASTAGAVSSVAAPFAPTANAVISAAVNGVTGGGTVMAGGTGAAAVGGMGVGGAALTGTAGSGWTPTGNASLDGQAKMMEMSQSFNMQYLSLQQTMQDENRRFSTISNVMKTKHDTAKNAISNLK